MSVYNKIEVIFEFVKTKILFKIFFRQISKHNLRQIDVQN